MTNEEKINEIENLKPINWISKEDLCTYQQGLHRGAFEMARWKDSQFDRAFDKALEHQTNKLKEGKITQYGMDNVLAFVENVRYLLSHEC